MNINAIATATISLVLEQLENDTELLIIVKNWIAHEPLNENQVMRFIAQSYDTKKNENSSQYFQEPEKLDFFYFSYYLAYF